MILKNIKYLFIVITMFVAVNASMVRAEPIQDVMGPPVVLAFWGQGLVDSIHKDVEQALDRFYQFMQSAWDTLSGYLRDALKWFWSDVVEPGAHKLAAWFQKWFDEYAKPLLEPIWSKVKTFGELDWSPVMQWTAKANAFLPLDIAAAELTAYMSFWSVWSVTRIAIKLARGG